MTLNEIKELIGAITDDFSPLALYGQMESGLVYAIAHDDVSTFKATLQKRKCDIRRDMKHVGHSFYALSSGWERFDMCSYLLEKGADVDTSLGTSSKTSLERMFVFGNPKSQNNEKWVDLFLKYGADVNRKVSDFSLLQLACARGFSGQVIHRLIEAGADMNYQYPQSGQTALMMSVMAENGAATQVLLKNGANADLMDKRGRKVSDYAQSVCVSARSKPVASYYRQSLMRA